MNIFMNMSINEIMMLWSFILLFNTFIGIPAVIGSLIVIWKKSIS